jgi:hypothetical protein
MIVYDRTYFGDLDGDALDNGKLYIGEPNKDPEIYPAACFWDECLTIPATQPLRVNSGYVTNGGLRAPVYTSLASFSMRLRDRRDVLVDYIPDANSLLGSLISSGVGKGADLVGFLQAGAGAVARTAQAKMRDFINVMDFGAATNGITDSYPAFLAARTACPDGGRVFVPFCANGYFLSANPDPVSYGEVAGIGHNTRAKYINWDIAPGTQFSGPGVGLPDDAGLKFLSQITNPFNQTFGPIRQVDMTKQVTLNGGCLIGDTMELAEDFGYAFSFTGDVTNGSSTITNASVNLVGKVKRGDRLESAIPGPRFRVWDVLPDGKTIQIGIDAGAGPAGPSPWGGVSQAGLQLTIVKKAWYALEYRGITTGGPNSRDMAYGIRNDVINITGGPANSYEIDMISLATTAMFNRCIFGTGHGEAPNTMTFMDIQRAGATPWSAAIAVRCATVGAFLNAKNPLTIDAVYLNPTTGLPEPINYGLHLNNSPAIRGAIVEGRQITDGSQMFVGWRATDTNPNQIGRFMQYMNAANTDELFLVDINGAIATYAPASSNGSTTNSGGIQTNGLTLRGGTNLQIGSTGTAGAVSPTHWVTMGYTSDGKAIQVNCRLV